MGKQVWNLGLGLSFSSPQASRWHPDVVRLDENNKGVSVKEKKEGQGQNPEQGQEVGKKHWQSKLEERALEAEIKPDEAPSETRRGQDPREEGERWTMSNAAGRSGAAH